MINYKKMNKDAFIKRSIILSLIGDGLFCIFVLILFSPHNVVKFLEKYPMMTAMNPNLKNLAPEDMIQLGQVFYSTAQTMVMMILALNFFAYYRYSKEGTWGIGYMKMLGLTGGILSLLSFSEGATVHFLWGVILVALSPLYFYIYFGVKYHFDQKAQRTK